MQAKCLQFRPLLALIPHSWPLCHGSQTMSSEAIHCFQQVSLRTVRYCSTMFSLSADCWADKPQAFINNLLEEEQKLLTNSHQLRDFNSFYRSLMGYGLPIKSYNMSKNRKHLTTAANVLMQYRLCDIIAWTLSNETSGAVPLHKKRGFKLLHRSVSFLLY